VFRVIHSLTGVSSKIVEIGFDYMLEIIFGTRADPGFNAQEHTNKSLTTVPFDNTCKADEVSLEVEIGLVARLRCLQP
jgi:hypothetical protein